jgi:hypothetical protein
LHDDSQSCCIFFSSLQTCSPFLPMHHKLSFAETLASFFAMYWVVHSPSVICLVLSPSSKSLPCTITCILRTLLHMLSNSLAANNDTALKYMAEHPNT